MGAVPSCGSSGSVGVHGDEAQLFVGERGSVGAFDRPHAVPIAHGGKATSAPPIVPATDGAGIVLVGAADVAVRSGVVDLPGVLIAPRPRTSVVSKQGREAGGSGEQAASSAEVDDDTGAIEHDSSHVPFDCGGDRIEGVDRRARGGLAAPLEQQNRPEMLEVIGEAGARGQGSERILERVLIDQNVDLRRERPDRRRARVPSGRR